MKKYKNVFLSVGSNMGDQFKILIKSIIEIENLNETFIQKISSFYKTDPVGYTNQPDFINYGVYIKTKQKPYTLLKNIQKIEKKLHRERKIRWGARTLDIDIIFYGDLNIKRDDLIIPHKEYKNRNFVLYPLNEIYPKKYYRKASFAGNIQKIYFCESIILSACLAGVNCKYNGKSNYSSVIQKISRKVNFVLVCPEQLGGLPTPRKPVEIQENRKVATKDGEDYTNEFEKGALEALKVAKFTEAKLAILKSKSPSCGYNKIYDGNFTKTLKKENGKTAEIFIENKIDVIEFE